MFMLILCVEMVLLVRLVLIVIGDVVLIMAVVHQVEAPLVIIVLAVVIKKFLKKIFIYRNTIVIVINYNGSANKDDGSCILKVLGCTDKNAINYNSNANTDDGSCIAKVLGCMDEKADNYDEKANTADGKCLYTTTKKK